MKVTLRRFGVGEGRDVAKANVGDKSLLLILDDRVHVALSYEGKITPAQAKELGAKGHYEDEIVCPTLRKFARVTGKKLSEWVDYALDDPVCLVLCHMASYVHVYWFHTPLWSDT